MLNLKLPNSVDVEVHVVAAAFLDNHVSETVFFELTDDELREIVPCVGDRKEVKRLQDRYSGSAVVTFSSCCILFKSMQLSRHVIVRMSSGTYGWLSSFSSIVA